jgi:MinD-like ATPase involved in chromosome partitioning or flagellar assembly
MRSGRGGVGETNIAVSKCMRDVEGPWRGAEVMAMRSSRGGVGETNVTFNMWMGDVGGQSCRKGNR